MGQATITPEVRARLVGREIPRRLQLNWIALFMGGCAWLRLNWMALFMGGCVWFVIFQLVRAAIRFPHWAWMVR